MVATAEVALKWAAKLLQRRLVCITCTKGVLGHIEGGVCAKFFILYEFETPLGNGEMLVLSTDSRATVIHTMCAE